MKRVFLFLLVIPFCSLSQTTIDIEEIGGVYQVPCKVNGLNLKFIFDTGAADVSIAKNEAIFMIKYGYLSQEDIVGLENYQMADGDIVEGVVVNIKKLEIGDIILEDVRASIIDSDNAPLLLGQSVIKELGDYKFDYDNNKLIISKGTIYDCLEGDCENGDGKIISSLGTLSLDLVKQITEGKFIEGKLNGNGKHSFTIHLGEKFFNETENVDEDIFKELYSKTLSENQNIVEEFMGDGSNPEEVIVIIEYNGEFKNDKLLNGNINSITLDEFGDSIITSIIPIKNGLINGDLKQYRSDDNKIRISGKVVNSKKEGKHLRYYGKGENYVLIEEENYLNGKLNGESRSYWNGNLTSKKNFLNDKKNGVFEYYKFNEDSKENLLSGYYEYKNDLLIKETEWINGYNYGDYEYFTSEGIPGVENKNKNGVIIKEIGDAIIGIHDWNGNVEYTWEKKYRVEDNGRNRKEFEEKIYYKKSGKLYAERIYLYGSTTSTSIKYYETGELMMIAYGLGYLQRSNYTEKVTDKFYYKNGNLMLETPPLILFDGFRDSYDWYRNYSQNFPDDFPEGSTYSGTAYHDDGSKLFDFKFISTKERDKMTDKSNKMWQPTYNDLFNDYENENGIRSTKNWLFYSRAGLNHLNGLKINNIFYKNGEIQSVLNFDEKTGLQYISCYTESGNKKTCDKKELNTISKLIYHLLHGGSL